MTTTITEKDCRKFTKTQWKGMRVITPPDARRGMVKADSDGDMWLWFRSNGKHVWASRFTHLHLEPPDVHKGQAENCNDCRLQRALSELIAQRDALREALETAFYTMKQMDEFVEWRWGGASTQIKAALAMFNSKEIKQ